MSDIGAEELAHRLWLHGMGNKKSSLAWAERFLESYEVRRKPDSVPVIEIVFTVEDVRAMAEDNGIDPDVAVDRASEWGRHIASTMAGYCSEQLESVVLTGQP